MSNVAVTNTFVANTTAVASEVNTNFNDIVTWLNGRNAGSTPWDNLKLANSLYITPTANQIILGTTTLTTISATAPAVSRTVTIPDPGAAASFVLTESAQTINGTKTLSGDNIHSGANSIRYKYRSVVTTDSVAAADEVNILSGNTFTSTLPTAVGISGKEYKFIHNDTSLTKVYTIATTSAQTISGASTIALYTNGETVTLVSNGANWIIVNHTWNTAEIDGGTNTVTGTSVNPTKATTPDIDKVTWHREGSYAVITWRYKQSATTGAASGTGQYLWATPTGLTADTTYFPVNAATTDSDVAATLVGDATIALDSSTNGIGFTYLYDSTHVWLKILQGAASYLFMASTLFSFSGAAQMGLTATAKIPISGWLP